MGKVKAVHDRTGFIGQITDDPGEPVLQAHGAGQERR